MGINPHNITRDFEEALCEYTGARFAVATTSCTMALLLAVAWHLKDDRRKADEALPELEARSHGKLVGDMNAWKMPIEIPKRTYLSVPMSIIHAGGRPTFRDEQWVGAYQLKPLPVWDYARMFTSGMYVAGQMQCLSFHAAKILGDTQGGAILHDDSEVDAWLRRARFDGRTEHVAPMDDNFSMIGWHAYMSPDVAARLLFKLSILPKHNVLLLNDDYPDLSEMRIFR